MLKFNLKVVAVSLVLLIVNSAALAAKPTKLAQIFNADTIDADLSYLEYMTGPARNTHDAGNGFKEKVYRVDGCEVTANIERGVVRSLGLTLSPSCSFKLNAFLVNYPKLTKPIHKMTFGQVGSALNGGGSFTPSCFYGNCGNAVDPSTYASFTLPNSGKNYEIMLEAFASPEYEQWRDVMVKDIGEKNIVFEKNPNCTGKYNGVAERIFKNATITRITIGKEIPPLVTTFDPC